MPIAAQPNSCGQPYRGVVHLQALEHLGLGQLGRLVTSDLKAHAAGQQPLVVQARLRIAHLAHGGVQRGLTQPLLEESERVQQMIGDDRVVHPHAAFVEHAEDGLVRLERVAERGAAIERPRVSVAGHGSRSKDRDVRAVVIDAARSHTTAPARDARTRR